MKGKKKIFKLQIKGLKECVKLSFKKLKNFLKKNGIRENVIILTTLFSGAFFVIIYIVLKNKFLEKTTFYEGILIESVGMLFDIFVLGILFNIFYNRGERGREVKRLKEEINVYRCWVEKGAMFRIVVNVKRLISLNEKRLLLNDCYLESAFLERCDLQGAFLQNSILNSAKLKFVGLQKANLQHAWLKNANLQVADLRGANLLLAKLINADLRSAKLQKAEIQGANFSGANLKEAFLQGADFSGANLTGVKGIEVDQLLEVKSLCNVKGLDPVLEAEIRAKKPELFENPNLQT